MVVPIEINVKTPDEYTELRECKVHKKKVVATYLDAKLNQMYSISEDKCLKVMDFKSKEVVNSVQISKYKPTKWIVHEESKTFFVSTKGGEIILVDFGSVSFFEKSFKNYLLFGELI